MTQNMNTEALCQIQYGVFIVTSFNDEKINGQIATVVFQVTSDPIQIATCICKKNLTHEFITKTKSFGVSILSQEADLKFIGKFGFRCGRDFDKFIDTNYKTENTGAPLVTDNSTGILDVRVKQALDIGTHTLFVGELLFSEKLNDKTPLTYDHYHNFIKGKTHENAPTFNPGVKK